MIKTIAIYPHPVNEEYKEKVQRKIELASIYGFDEVFTTIHLPEISLEEQLEAFELISKLAKEVNLEITVDIGGTFFDDILENEEILNKLKNIDFDFIRLDYGSDINKTRKLYSLLSFRGIVINASIYNEEETIKEIELLKAIDEKIEIRACHNFYPQPDTGIDETFAQNQDQYFKERKIPVYYCIPTHSNSRGPLHEGLCTVEKHRYQSITSVLSDLYINYDLSAFMMADEWLSEEEFKEVEHTLKVLQEPLDDIVTIEVELFENTSDVEKNIVLKNHQFRFDSSFDFLRSQTTREMAEFASVVPKNNTIALNPGMITIDNELYKRYSGELKVVFTNKEANEKINVVGMILNPDDIIRLRRFREGYLYKFVERDS